MNRLRNLITQAIDLHVHVGPEIIPRKFLTQTLILSEKNTLKGMALKNHFFSTVPFIAEQTEPDIRLFGSIVLNHFVGGLNPDAIYAASTIAKERFIVWFPTIHASQFLNNSIWEIAPEWVGKQNIPARSARDILGISICTEQLVLNPQAVNVLRAIKSAHAILATGHISWNESLLLIKKAYEMGITQSIVTHPQYQKIMMPLETQETLIQYGAIIEHCYSMYSIDSIPIKNIANQIKHVEAKHCILSSDVGQTFSLSPSEALYEFARLLLKHGITYEELELMLVVNPLNIVDQT